MPVLIIRAVSEGALWGMLRMCCAAGDVQVEKPAHDIQSHKQQKGFTSRSLAALSGLAASE